MDLLSRRSAASKEGEPLAVDDRIFFSFLHPIFFLHTWLNTKCYMLKAPFC
jgi:hypothetical protein